MEDVACFAALRLCAFALKTFERVPGLAVQSGGGLPQSKTLARKPARQISPRFRFNGQHLPTCASARATFS
jgi:hypothetical protein